MLIYCREKNNRIKYIFNYVFGERLGIEYSVITNQDSFKKSTDHKINYSNNNLPSDLHILPDSLLFETGINSDSPKVKNDKNSHLFPQNEGDLEFDIFAACFWIITRYEEYNTKNKDIHSRYYPQDSLGFKKHFLKQPIIDLWISEFRVKLNSIFPNIKCKKETFEILPTIDIDSAWCYQNKGVFRFLGANFRDFLKGNLKTIKDRILVVLRIKKDPHYQFIWLKNLYHKLNLKPLFFVLASQHSKFDKNTSVKKSSFKKFINDIKNFGEIGVHFSYYAAEDAQKMKQELKTLTTISKINIHKNRQHFLRFQLPQYYRSLLKQGITDDYSMGYAQQIGFRAGTSRSFLFYDLEQEYCTNLRVHPFCIMDVSLKNYQKKDKNEAQQEINKMIDRLKKVDGKFVTLWHNESLSDYDQWKGWKELYKEMLTTASN